MIKHPEDPTRYLAQKVISTMGEGLINAFGLQPAIEILENGTRHYPKSKVSQKERTVCDNLAAKLPGSKTEVTTDTGRIDILTPSEIIEVKNVRKYKEAIGQVMSYSYYYPKHKRRIHLFGKVSVQRRSLIKKECRHLGVKVTFAD